MQHALKPYATAGVAIVGASLIAATPVVAPLPINQVVRDVAPTAGGLPDLVAPYTPVFNEAQDNISAMLNSYYLAPNIWFQQALANLSGYIQQILTDPSSIPTVTTELQQDVKAVLSAFTLMNADQDSINSVIPHTMDGSALGGHSLIFGQLPGFLPAGSEFLIPFMHYLGSPMSGVFMGSIGPWIAPGVAFGQSLQDFFGSLQTGDVSGAFQDLAGIPANMLNGFLNGATLDLDSLVPAINDAGVLPNGMSVTHLDIAFGGLLSPGGHITAGPDYNVADPDGNVIAHVPVVGGSIFNSIGLGLDGIPVLNHLDLVSDPIGPIGSWLGLSQTIAAQIGWGSDWDGKNGGTVPALPPAIGIHLPTLPDDFFDDGGAGSGAALGFDDILSGLVSSIGG